MQQRRTQQAIFVVWSQSWLLEVRCFRNGLGRLLVFGERPKGEGAKKQGAYEKRSAYAETQQFERKRPN